MRQPRTPTSGRHGPQRETAPALIREDRSPEPKELCQLDLAVPATPKGYATYSKKGTSYKLRLVPPAAKWQLDPGTQGTIHVLSRSSAWQSQPRPQAPSLCLRPGPHPCSLGREGRERGGGFAFALCRYSQLVFEAEFGRLVPAAAAERPVGVAVWGAWGPVVTFLPFGGWGCQEQGHDREPRARIRRRPHRVTVSTAALLRTRTSHGLGAKTRVEPGLLVSVRDAGDSRNVNLICFCLKITNVQMGEGVR